MSNNLPGHTPTMLKIEVFNAFQNTICMALQSIPLSKTTLQNATPNQK
jgi:hypothetical protein